MQHDAVPMYDSEPDSFVSEVLSVENQILESLSIPRAELPDGDEMENVRFVKRHGEYYINPFDFFQQIQRWMYNAGMFNIF